MGGCAIADEAAAFGSRGLRCRILFLEAGKAEFTEREFFHCITFAPPDCGETTKKWSWKEYLNVVSISVYGGLEKLIVANRGKLYK